ncbi:hypothetical protein CRENBAI_014404, partial [Crenichthys baileyi]
IRSWGQQVRQATPYNPFPGDILQLILRDPKAFPGQMGYIVPPVGFGSSPGSPHSGKCLENLQREAPRRHLNQMPDPPELTPFDVKEQWLYFMPPSPNKLFHLWQRLNQKAHGAKRPHVLTGENSKIEDPSQGLQGFSHSPDTSLPRHNLTQQLLFLTLQ